MSMAAKISGMEFIPPPPQTATGSLINYITDPAVINFQPMNINYGIIQSPDVPKKDKKPTIHEIALNNIFGWVKH